MPAGDGVSAVEDGRIVFRHADPDHHLVGVRLWQELDLAPNRLDFGRVPSGWELRLPLPTVHRLEYLFETRTRGAGIARELDAANPATADAPFGRHSVLELPAYVRPQWLDGRPVDARVERLSLSAAGSAARMAPETTIWSPADGEPTEPLPLLMAHDGPELVTYARLTDYVGTLIAAKQLPRMRVALLAPGERNQWYAANVDYAAALTQQVLPTIRATYACLPDAVLMGVSLGALAALHTECVYPGTFAGLFMQSGSFFAAKTDPQERRFTGFSAVTPFVDQVLRAPVASSTPMVAMTCGATEENVHNNRVMAARLDQLGCDVSYAESNDVHNFTAWRDMFDPHLTALLHRVWG